MTKEDFHRSETAAALRFALAFLLTLALTSGLTAFRAAPLAAQDINMLLSADSIESLLRSPDFVILASAGARFDNDRTQRVVLGFGDSTKIMAKWAKAPSGAWETFNNRPRYEVAAYELQKLFLDEPEYVVPPTVARCVTVQRQREIESWADATFSGTESVLIVLQYWLWNVTADDVWNKDRFRSDSAYARHFANLDLFTYLILHSDSNKGNVLISSVDANPRLFAVDNGVAFDRREKSERGTRWRGLRVDRLPRSTVERLRELTPEDLERHLAVVAQFRQDGYRLVPTGRTEALDAGQGVRRSGAVLQLGLTDREIAQVWGRIRKVLQKVDEGKIELF
jgi:hypothetical protein